jgi:hypothetical protein
VGGSRSAGDVPGIDPGDLVALVEPGHPDVAEPAIGYPFTTLTDRLDRLEERGHIRREPNPEDRRSHLVSVTPDGEALARRAGPALKRTLSLVDRHLQVPVEDVTRAVTELHHALRDALRR